jgi:NitT/TauT family transport system permease protein
VDDSAILASLRARRRRDRIAIHLWRVAIVLAALVFWQAGSGPLFNPRWFSNPTAVAFILGQDLASPIFWGHVLTTLAEMAAGFVVGVPLGAIAGLAYGSARRLGAVAYPLVIGIYSIPLVALSPLFILWFGLGILAKAALVAVTVFWLIFFNVAAGIAQVDRDLLAAIRQLGGGRIDAWRLVILPSVAEWFFAGVKLSVPYALVGAVVAEMVASSDGLGYLATRAASFLRMDALYAVVIVLGVLGVLLNTVAERIEGHFGRWQPNRQVRL